MAEEYGYRTMNRKVQVTVCRHEGTVHPLRGGVPVPNFEPAKVCTEFVPNLYLRCTKLAQKLWAEILSNPRTFATKKERLLHTIRKIVAR